MLSKLLTTGLALSLTPSLLAQESATDAVRKVLPVGSSLHDIRIPRYDSNYQQTSLLTAERMDMLAENRLKGTHVQLELFDKGKAQANTHLNSAIYHENQEILHSLENLTVSGNEFDIAAQGVILNWKNRTGFLLGKTQTFFYSQEDTEMRSPQNQQTPPEPKKKSSPFKTATKKAALVTSSIPALLTAEEIEQIDQLAQPSTELIAKIDSDTAKTATSMEASSKQLDVNRNTLKEKVLPVVQQQTTPTEEAEPLTKREDQVPVSVTSDRGMYFDAVTGTAIYQNNVVVIHPQVRLTCSDELKVLLKKSETTTVDTKSSENSQFDGLDKAIATGNVIINAKDSSGKLITARSEIATYDGDTGVIILKGGRPTVKQGNQIARILSDSGYIKILPNMSVRLEGKSEILADLNELQNQ